MKSLLYKREWTAKERIAKALKDGSLISWYVTDHYYVVIVRKFL